MRRARSTRSTPSACRRPAPTSAPAAPPASVRDAPAGCGMPATGCARMASPTSPASIWPGRCSTLAAWGTDPETFAWFEAPPAEAVAAAAQRCCSASARSTAARSPRSAGACRRCRCRPRLARILIEAGGARDAARACAILSERQLAPARREATTCDLLGSLDAWASLPPHVHQVARPDRGSGRGPRRVRSAAHLGRRICAGRCSSATPIAWPGAASRRARRWCSRPGPAPCSAARAASATASSWSRSTSRRRRAPADPNALVRVASRVEPEWIVPTQVAVEHAFDPRTGRVRAWRRSASIGCVLAEHAQAPEPAAAARRWRRRGWRASPTRSTPPGCAASASPA